MPVKTMLLRADRELLPWPCRTILLALSSHSRPMSLLPGASLPELF